MSQKIRENGLPDREQALLLRAALQDGKEAIDCWNEWQHVVRIEDIDHASYRLLPLVYSNLKAQVSMNPLMQRIKGVYRHTWSKNQFMMESASGIIRCFQQATIPTMLLKGSALMLIYYKDYGLRPMNDVDVMIPFERATKAMTLLQETGYIPIVSVLPFSERHIPLIHAYNFTKGGRMNIDLHWHLVDECRQHQADDDFWKDSMEIDFCGVRTRVLNAADQLLHILVHGLRWDAVRPVRWVADAMMILRSSHQVDWQRFVRQSEIRGLTLPIVDSLQYLTDHFDAAIPACVLADLRAVPVSRTQRLEYQYRMQDHTKSIWGNLPLLWFSYCRSAVGSKWYRKPFGFLRYLKEYWAAPSWWLLPAFAFTRIMRKMRLVLQPTDAA